MFLDYDHKNLEFPKQTCIVGMLCTRSIIICRFRRRQLEKEYELVRARLEQEEKNPGTLTIKLDSTDGPNTTIEDTTRL